MADMRTSTNTDTGSSSLETTISRWTLPDTEYTFLAPDTTGIITWAGAVPLHTDREWMRWVLLRCYEQPNALEHYDKYIRATYSWATGCRSAAARSRFARGDRVTSIVLGSIRAGIMHAFGESILARNEIRHSGITLMGGSLWASAGILDSQQSVVRARNMPELTAPETELAEALVHLGKSVPIMATIAMCAAGNYMPIVMPWSADDVRLQLAGMVSGGAMAVLRGLPTGLCKLVFRTALCAVDIRLMRQHLKPEWELPGYTHALPTTDSDEERDSMVEDLAQFSGWRNRAHWE